MSPRALLLGLALLGVARSAAAQEPPPDPPLLPADPPAPITTAPPATPPPPPYGTPIADPAVTPGEPAPMVEPPERMSEGRRIVVAWNTGFQWSISPGVFFRDGDAAFALGLRFGYGFDTGSVIIVPGVKLAGYFATPNVYLGMPVMKLVFPIDRFAPFIEGGVGVGYQDSSDLTPSGTGVALMGGGGFMVHFNIRFGLGVEANYETITGTDFHGIGIGPILALAF